MNLPLRAYWNLLSRHIRPQGLRFGLLSTLLFGSIGLQLINPQIMRGFIDAALGGEAPLQTLTLSALAFIAIALVQQTVAISVTYLGENVAWTATNALRAELAWHCLNLDMGFHNTHTPGELIERIDGDVTELATFFSQFVITLLGNLLLMIGILVALFLEDWRAGLAFTGFALVALFLLNRVRDIAVPDQKARRQGEAELFGFIEEQLNGTEDVRANGAVGYSLGQLTRLQSVIFKADSRSRFKSWLIHMLMGGSLLAGNLLAIGSGYWLFQAGAITLGTVYLFVHYMNMLETPIHALIRQVESFQTIGACVERLTELRAMRGLVLEGTRADLPTARPTDPEAAAAAGLLPSRSMPQEQAGSETSGDTPVYTPEGSQHQGLALDLRGMSFAYADGDGDPVLSGLNFHLVPGTVLGLLGRTGSGKTTLARLLLRLYDPTQGKILLNGVDLKDLKLETLRHHVSIVTQDVQLFRASVRENLTFFNPAISDAQIEGALQALELGDWYQGLPAGLDTMLEEGGAGLSAGEAQLLAFTRVFLRSPGLVILDEASSRLDKLTEQRIERAIDKLLLGRSAIIIAHRLGTVHRADEIMILENGQVLEHGPRLELASDPASRFYHLLETGLEEVLV